MNKRATYCRQKVHYAYMSQKAVFCKINAFRCELHEMRHPHLRYKIIKVYYITEKTVSTLGELSNI